MKTHTNYCNTDNYHGILLKFCVQITMRKRICDILQNDQILIAQTQLLD